MNKIRVADFVANFLLEKGIKDVFLLPGGGAIHLVDAVGKARLNYVCCLHEQGASIAAEAYAQISENIGCAIVTTGPGGTNTITGVASAWIDSIPCLFISGQVKTSDLLVDKGVRQFGFQEVDIVNIVKPITKYAVTVTNPDKIKYYLEKAFFIAKSGRPGPVWIDIPLDVQAKNIDPKKLSSYNPANNSGKIDDNVIKKIIDLINKSKRPVILAGNGIRLSGALPKFFELIEKLNLPVQTTWKTIDILHDTHPLFAGRPGLVASRFANFTLQNADLLISIGSRLDFGLTAYNHKYFARNAKKVIIDIDENEIKKMNMKVDVPVVADAKDFIEKMLENMYLVKKIDRSKWFEKIYEWKLKYPVAKDDYLSETDYVNDYELIDILSELLGHGDILVPGSSGACSERTMQAFRVKKGVRILNSPGLGAMGFGLPASIGACIGSGRKRTVCINGDGGFMLNIQELEVVKRLDLPIKFFVLNNNGYASIRGTQKRFFGRLCASSPETGMTLPLISKIAESFGVEYVQLKNRDLKQTVEYILKHEGPILCEVFTSPNMETLPRVSSKQLSDGSIVSLPMEDMYPFLNREALKREMLVPILPESKF
jgi:acetolactate synthase-1/2/3 large subunit